MQYDTDGTVGYDTDGMVLYDTDGTVQMVRCCTVPMVRCGTIQIVRCGAVRYRWYGAVRHRWYGAVRYRWLIRCGWQKTLFCVPGTLLPHPYTKRTDSSSRLTRRAVSPVPGHNADDLRVHRHPAGLPRGSDRRQTRGRHRSVLPVLHHLPHPHTQKPREVFLAARFRGGA